MGSLVLASCGNNQKQAVVYNNNLVKIQQEVAAETPKFNQLLQAADSAEAYKLLADLSTYIGDEQKKAAVLQFDGDDFGMKAALLEGFDFFRKVLAEDFKKLLGLRFARPAPADARQQVQQIVHTIQQQGAMVDKKFVRAQKQFAKKYNITLQRP